MIYNQLILNHTIWEQLKKMRKNNTLPHALIFHGPEGTGKEAHAIEFAALLNSNDKENYEEKLINFQHPNINLIIPFPREKSINKKSDALKAISDKSLDLLIEMKKEKIKKPYNKVSFDKASNILINSIRDIKKNIYTAINNENDYMVYLIFEAEKLCVPKTESGNALLKILEEPPERTMFILVTSKKNKLLKTIQSRCCHFYFPKISKQKIVQYLNDYKEYNTQEIDLIIKLSNNNMMTILQMIKLGEEIHILKNDAINFIKNIINDKNWDKNIKDIESLFKSKKERFKILIKLIIFILHDLEKIKNKKRNCVILTEVNKVKKLNYSKAIDVIEKNYLDLKKNLNSKIVLFAMAIEMRQKLYE